MTNDPTSNAPRLNPRETIEQVARALPEQVRSNVIICGSLAAAYNFFSGDSAASLRTKDVDVLLSPHAVSVGAAVQVTEQLLAENWQQKTDSKYPPGGPDVPLKQLPVVRLEPPTGDAGAEKWFLELLAAPPTERTPTEVGATGFTPRESSAVAGNALVSRSFDSIKTGQACQVLTGGRRLRHSDCDADTASACNLA